MAIKVRNPEAIIKGENEPVYFCTQPNSECIFNLHLTLSVLDHIGLPILEEMELTEELVEENNLNHITSSLARDLIIEKSNSIFGEDLFRSTNTPNTLLSSDLGMLKIEVIRSTQCKSTTIDFIERVKDRLKLKGDINETHE